MEVDPSRPLLTVDDAAISNNLGTPSVLATLDTALQDDALDAQDLTLMIEAVRAGLGIDLLAAAAAPPPEAAVHAERRALIEARINERLEARAAKDFATADRIRQELLGEHRVALADGPEGTTWPVVPSP